MPKSKNKENYVGNMFSAIPLKIEEDSLIIRDIYVVYVSEELCKCLSFTMKNVINGLSKLKDGKAFSPYKFSMAIQNLNYEVVAAQNNFLSNNGEWIYLLEEPDIELLRFQFRKWCRYNLDDSQIEYINHCIDEINIEKRDIVIPPNPHNNLNEKEKFYLYKLYPQYLTHILSGKLKVNVQSVKENKVSKHNFYKLQNKEQNPTMIALPIKHQGDEGYWTYSLDIFIKNIAEINYPFIFLNLRVNRFFSYIPNGVKKELNGIAYNKCNDGYEAIKMPLVYYEKEELWKWKYDLSVGFKSKWLNSINSMSEQLSGEEKQQELSNDIGIGFIYGSHIRKKHKITPRSSEYDEQAVFNKVLDLLKSEETKTNVKYEDFMKLENIYATLDKGVNKDKKFRLSQLPDFMEIDVIYSTEAWINYLKDGFIELFQSEIFADPHGFAKANDISFNDKNQEFTIKYKENKEEKNKKIRLNLIRINQEERSKFLFKYNKGELSSFKGFINVYIEKSEKIKGVLFELEYAIETAKGIRKVFDNNHVDPKSIIRNLLAQNNYVSQFITYQQNPYYESIEEKGIKKKYKDELIKYMNGIKDLFRQLGIIGKSVFKEDNKDNPILVGLWFMSKYKSTFEFGNKDRLLPQKLTLPILTAVIDNKVKIALFSGEVFANHRRIGKSFNVQWVDYSEGIISISKNSKIFDELNDSYAKKLKKQFINNALASIYGSYPQKQIILYTNAQNSRQYISGLTNDNISDEDLDLDLEDVKGEFWENTVLIRLVTEEQNETPGWIHIDKDGLPLYKLLCQGAFKVTDRIYYLINAKGDNHSYSADAKEFDINNTGLRMSVLEVGVFRTKTEDVKKYVSLTEILRSRSMAVNFATPIRLPLPIHLAASAYEYVKAYYDEYFICKWLDRKKEEQ
ncbi:RNaseH domain-containing protein [Clostridium sp. DJ247]|uniref:RNaseH domain-containing protein n=1 Tax=Clostridium sp. DJ247 TaxID=2726188 RepID=UPI00162442C1|nr:RNaseH domain-containing protein [Clostridium sp. DJ247]MBC2582289.1 RNAseH domain-containing protein [Clostridium sp. DJ247]